MAIIVEAPYRQEPIPFKLNDFQRNFARADNKQFMGGILKK